MSHIANIRSRYRQDEPQEPQKRRRIDGPDHKVNGILPTTNGSLLNGNVTAHSTHDAKVTSKAAPAEAANVRNPDPEVDTEMMNGVSDSDAEDSEESDDDEDDDEFESAEDGETSLAPAVDGSDPKSLGEENSETQDTTSNSDQGADGVEDESMIDADADSTNTKQAPAEPAEEPSFGDLLSRNNDAPIDITASYAEAHPTHHQNQDRSTTTPANRTLTVPTATSLGTVLTQALRTNDTDLLESCLQVPNLESIRATIERLHSSHATSLLQKLAERLHKRPGRAGSLMVWVQWTVVAHGGYLASQPAAMRELHTLHSVVKQRATGLQPLLALKGKLDLLEAQMQLRRNVQARSRARHPEQGEGVTYVEGEEESSSDEEAGGTATLGATMPKLGPTSTLSTKPGKRMRKQKGFRQPSVSQAGAEEGDDEDVEEDMPTTLSNGVDGEGFENFADEDDESEDDEEDLIDDEAEETDESGDELDDDVQFDDDDDSESESEDEEDETEARPAKKPKA